MRPSGPLGSMIVGLTAGVLTTVLTLLPGDRGEPAEAPRPRVTGTPPPPVRAPAPAPAQAASPAPVTHSATRPVIDSNFPDPMVLRAGSMYYAYATNAGGAELPVATAPTVKGPWKRLPGDGLARLPAWADSGRTWAPEVIAREDGARMIYVLYLSARKKGEDKQCIGVATSPVPQGPFTPVGDEPLVCPLELGGAIDPSVFVDADGSRHLLYKARGDYRPDRPAAIYLQRLTPDALAPDGPPRRILARDSTEPVLVEAPELVHRNGKYVLLYASGWYFNDTYETRYAVATSIGGPYRKAGAPVQSTDGYDAKVVGPGSVEVVEDETGEALVFHGILRGDNDGGLVRGMFVADLGWIGERPVIRGAPQFYEAEHGGRGAGVAPLARPRASGRRAVGGRNGWLEIKVYAPAGGRYAITIAHADRSGAPAKPKLTVNGGGQTTVAFRRTGPGRWAGATLHRELHGGWNTLRLHHLGDAEVDRVEVR